MLPGMRPPARAREKFPWQMRYRIAVHSKDDRERLEAKVIGRVR